MKLLKGTTLYSLLGAFFALIPIYFLGHVVGDEYIFYFFVIYILLAIRYNMNIRKENSKELK